MRNYPGLSETQRQEIADALARVLADTYALYFKTHTFHWNVEGARFYGLHKMFEEQYTEMWNAVDNIAERIRALGHPAPASYASLSRLSSVKEQSAVPSTEAMIRELIEGHESVTNTVRAAISKAQEAKDEATVGILATRLEVHDKTAWMLSALAK